MTEEKVTRSGRSVLRRYAWGMVAAWTAVIGASLGWNIIEQRKQTDALVHKEAVTHFNKDQAFRFWGTRHGGVYVPITAETPPSDYMDFIPERDIVTPSGVKLTLLNPAYMVRQLMGDYDRLYGVKGKITGLVAIHPDNIPDAWEENALHQLEAGAKEVVEDTTIDGEPYLRMIRPMHMEEGCVKCHGPLGFKVGDLRGGVSVAVPKAPYLAGQMAALAGLIASHLVIWGLGLGGIHIGARQIRRHIEATEEASATLRQSEERLRDLNMRLEQRVEERTLALTEELSERHRAEGRLREHEERLRTVLDNAADGIVTASETMRIESFNAAAERIFGYSAGEVIGQPVTMLMNPRDAARHDGYVLGFLESGQSRIVGTGREVLARRKGGEEFPLYLAISVVNLGDKRLFTAILRDLTEAKKAEVALTIAKEQAEKANRAKSQFLSSMSHELRTPMNGILGFAQLLQFNPKDPLSANQNEYVDLILRAGNHLLGLINEVLDLSRIESGNLQLSLETISPAGVAQETMELLAPLAAKRNIRLEERITGNPELPAIRADFVRFKQVLVNLGSNAIKYNREGGSVVLDCQAGPDGMLRFSITDTGKGIPKHRQAELFQPFNRLGAEAGEIEGTGIGLTITLRLVQLMDGHIGLESEEGVGSTFWVDMPVSTEAAAPEEKAVGPMGTASTAAIRGNHVVLYVEDNPANLRLMEELLGRFEGVSMLAAPNGELGIELARAHRPGLILMDINLPGIDGFGALAELQRDTRTREIPVVALSASAMPRDVERGLKAGFRAYLTKPLDVPRTLRTIDLMLNPGDTSPDPAPHAGR